MADSILEQFAGLPDPRRQAGRRRSFISSLPGTDADALARAVRSHWGIENKLHGSLDVSFGEDHSRVRTGHSAENLSHLRRIALNLLRAETTCKRGSKTKRLRAGWEHDDLLRVLQIQNAVARCAGAGFPERRHSGYKGVGRHPVTAPAPPPKHPPVTRPAPMLHALLFPKPKRDFPYQRWVRISVRTWHLLAMGYLLGGTATGLPMAEQSGALWHTFGSGAVFVGLEVYGSCVFLLQLKGIAVLAKLLLLGAAVAASGSPLPYLIAAVIIGGISSHMPGKYRYYSPYHGTQVKE